MKMAVFIIDVCQRLNMLRLCLYIREAVYYYKGDCCKLPEECKQKSSVVVNSNRKSQNSIGGELSIKFR